MIRAGCEGWWGWIFLCMVVMWWVLVLLLSSVTSGGAEANWNSFLTMGGVLVWSTAVDLWRNGRVFFFKNFEFFFPTAATLLLLAAPTMAIPRLSFRHYIIITALNQHGIIHKHISIAHTLTEYREIVPTLLSSLFCISHHHFPSFLSTSFTAQILSTLQHLIIFPIEWNAEIQTNSSTNQATFDSTQ